MREGVGGTFNFMAWALHLGQKLSIKRMVHKKSPDPVDLLIRIRAFVKKNRRRSTLPHSLPCSTIDAKELNFRVRDGNGCGLFAIATGYIGRTWDFRKVIHCMSHGSKFVICCSKFKLCYVGMLMQILVKFKAQAGVLNKV